VGSAGYAFETSPGHTTAVEGDTILRTLLAWIDRLAHELLKFGVVGGVGYVTDVGAFNLLRYAGGEGPLYDKPLTAKALSVTLATLVTYLGNRHWTWRHRERTDFRREYVLFFLLNGIGLAISLLCLFVSHYVLDLTSPLSDNISANVIGLVLGTTFRFWSYRTYVFKPRPEALVGSGVSDRAE
jgi:putative flippase GtrA